MSKNQLLVAVALCLVVFDATARKVAISVDSLLWRISAVNKDVIAAKSNHAAVQQGISVAKSARLPNVTASLDLNYLGDGTILDRDFSNTMRDKLPHFGNTLNVTVYQPLYQGGAINASIDLARTQAELAAVGVAQQIDASSIEALMAYLNLMKMQNLRKVYVQNIEATQKILDNMVERHRQGTALKNDITRYELRLSTLGFDLKSIDNSISVLNHDLVTLLSLGDDAEVKTIIPVGVVDENPEEFWQCLTAEHSHELKALGLTRTEAETGLRLERASRLPSVGLVLGDQLTGPVTFEIPAIDKNYNAWFAGISIKYNISSLWTSNKKARQKQLQISFLADKTMAIEDALNRRIHQAYVAMTEARQMLETEKVNVRLADENYAVVETRFENDMALLTDMLDASTAKLDAETRLVNANINLLLAYYQLKFISGTLN